MKRPILCLVDDKKQNLTDCEITALYDYHSIEILDDTALFCPCCMGGVIQYRFFTPNEKGGRCNECDVLHWHRNLRLDKDKQELVYIKDGKTRMVVPMATYRSGALISA